MYTILKIFTLFLSLIPSFLIYSFSNILAWVLRVVFGYRKKVILNNLDIINPAYSAPEKKVILKKFYRNLSDIILESFVSAGSSKQKNLDMVEVEGLDVFDRLEGKKVLVAGGHTANWEIAATTMSHYINRPVYGVYKRIENEPVERFFREARQKIGMIPVPMAEASITLSRSTDAELSMGLVADQHSSNLDRSIWVNFFRRPTCFLPGLEMFARRYSIAVVFANCVRIKRGKYRVSFEELEMNPRKTQPGEITKAYAKKLEEVILANPDLWLLSHKRWKAVKPDRDLKFDYTT